jgi:hypothetical protein
MDNHPVPLPEQDPEVRARRGSPDPAAPVRWDLVERIRREIEAGTYETTEKLEAALDRLVEGLQE